MDDDKQVFFENEEQFYDWVSHQEEGNLFAVDDKNKVYTVMCMDGDAPWAICYLKEFRPLTFKDLTIDFNLLWFNKAEMFRMIDNYAI
jgi:hypothetical protein